LLIFYLKELRNYLISRTDPTSPFTLQIFVYFDPLCMPFVKESLIAVEADLFMKGKQAKNSIILFLFYLIVMAYVSYLSII